MKITFLGATKQVTGSNFLVEAAGKKFLVDCGMFQGKGDTEAQNYKEFASFSSILQKLLYDAQTARFALK